MFKYISLGVCERDLLVFFCLYLVIQYHWLYKCSGDKICLNAASAVIVLVLPKHIYQKVTGLLSHYLRRVRPPPGILSGQRTKTGCFWLHSASWFFLLHNLVQQSRKTRVRYVLVVFKMFKLLPVDLCFVPASVPFNFICFDRCCCLGDYNICLTRDLWLI